MILTPLSSWLLMGLVGYTCWQVAKLFAALTERKEK